MNENYEIQEEIEENIEDEITEESILERRVFAKGIFTGIICTLMLLLGVNVLGIGSSQYDKKMNAVENLVKEKYLYSEDINQSVLNEVSFKAYVEGLGDPYSEYLTAEEMRSFQESIDGTFYGIGVQFNATEGENFMMVINVYDGSPAAKAGIKPGDKLIAVNGKKVSGMSSTDIISQVKGDKGTEVKVTLLRDGKEYTATCKREKIEVPTVEFEMQDGNIGCIRISEFSEVTYKQFEKAYNTLKKQGMEGLVIDLRNNLGGRVDTTCEILDLLLPEGEIMRAEDKDGNVILDASSDEESKFDKPMVVVVNGYSASASELFAGAMQDYGVTIVGVKSFGKGIVQQTFPFKDGSAVKLTTAEYYTPKGKTVHKKGIMPNVVENDVEKQLAKAVEIVNGKIKR